YRHCLNRLSSHSAAARVSRPPNHRPNRTTDLRNDQVNKVIAGFARHRGLSTAALALESAGSPAQPGSDLDDHRNDHRTPPVRLIHPAPDHPAYDLLQLVRLGHAVGDRGLER